MNIEERLSALKKLHVLLQNISDQELEQLINMAVQHNFWFSRSSVQQAYEGILSLLAPDALTSFVSNYKIDNNTSNKTVGIIMAGNIPGVGFHDWLMGVIANCNLVIKPSSDDKILILFITKKLIEIAPYFDAKISFVERLDVEKLDAIIATGSNNTGRYFEKYFSSKPNIIRKNRHSVAILTGVETDEELKLLGKDVFSYYGLGCRNITHVFVPENFDFTPLLDQWMSYEEVINHNKYANNYMYHKSILLVNGVKHLDTGFLLVTENPSLSSPVGVLYYSFYNDKKNLDAFLEINKEEIQCVVGSDHVSFGQAQCPSIADFADGIDTLGFILKLE